MQSCLHIRNFARWASFAAVCLLLGGTAAVPGQAAPRVRSVVRVDARTGKLVRTVVVSQPLPVAVDAAAGSTQPDASIAEIVDATAKKYEVDPLLVHSVIQVESSYNTSAVSPKGAQGLMQLIPATARRFGVSNSFDVKQNIEGGVRYLKYLSSLFPDSLHLTLAAYNAGEGAVWKYNNRVPPYRETEQYVHKVGSRYGAARRRLEAKKTQELETSAGALVNPHPRLVTYIDSEGRLHLSTQNEAGTP